MRKTIRVCLAVLLALSVLSLQAVFAAAAGVDGLAEIIRDTSSFLIEAVPYPGIEQVAGDWAVFALLRAGVPIDDIYARGYFDKAVGQLEAVRGVLSPVRYSEYSRVVIAMASIGADPRDVGGFDLIEPLLDYDMTVFQGINGPIFALLALSAAGYSHEPVTERYIGYILSRQFEDGGFALSGSVSDPDTTSMALTALSAYVWRDGEQQVDVADAVSRALERLSRQQRATGGFTSFSSTNSESVSQAIIALTCLGVSIDDERFVKNGVSLLDNLLSYYIKGRGFEHELGGGTSLMATEQALAALAALWRQRMGRCDIYDMSDAPALSGEVSKDGLPGKHPDIIAPGYSSPGDVFGGFSGLPDGPVSRSQFVAALVSSLGLSDDQVVFSFLDVETDDPFFDDIRTAYAYGLIIGRFDKAFDPAGFVTRQEAAVMVSRASALCGLGAGLSFDDTAIRNVLSQFTDYRTVAQWAGGALAFCYYIGILDDFELEIKPSGSLLMREAADMIYNMLELSRLGG